jgi:hypothetical protein
MALPPGIVNPNSPKGIQMSTKRKSNVREIPASGKAIVVYREPEFAFEFETVEKWNVVRGNGEILNSVPTTFEAAKGYGEFLMSGGMPGIRVTRFELIPVTVQAIRPIGFRF